LPIGDEWSHHYIRPRAVYFDNANTQFIVFADYLYPRGKENEIISPRDIYLVLGDGISDDGTEWYIVTHWDIRYVETSQISDHFDLDHRDYYTPFMNQYRTGIPRHGYFLNDMGEWSMGLGAHGKKL